MPSIYGLTLHRPWCWCIAYGSKRIENRSWAPNRRHIGTHIAIHSGKQWDEVGAEAAWKIDGHRIADAHVPPGQIIAVARLDSVISHAGDPPQDSPWLVGPMGWVLADVMIIHPVQCKGQQGLWPIQDQLLETVRESYRAAKRGKP